VLTLTGLWFLLFFWVALKTGVAVAQSGQQNACLSVYIRYAHKLQDTDPIFNNPDPYVRIEAAHSSTFLVKNSRTITGSISPTWNEWIDFGCQMWKVIILQVLDEDIGNDDAMSNRELIQLVPGNNTALIHHAFGNGYLVYDYSLTIYSNSCSSRPCLNGGTCRETNLHNFTCSCPHGFIGDTCQYAWGDLHVMAMSGVNLLNSDGTSSDSDPYMEFIAMDAYGRFVRKLTRYISNNRNPSWNQQFMFGNGAWMSLIVRVFDADPLIDDSLSDIQILNISNNRSQNGVMHKCYRGYTAFNFSY